MCCESTIIRSRGHKPTYPVFSNDHNSRKKFNTVVFLKSLPCSTGLSREKCVVDGVQELGFTLLVLRLVRWVRLWEVGPVSCPEGVGRTGPLVSEKGSDCLGLFLGQEHSWVYLFLKKSYKWTIFHQSTLPQDWALGFKGHEQIFCSSDSPE